MMTTVHPTIWLMAFPMWKQGEMFDRVYEEFIHDVGTK